MTCSVTPQTAPSSAVSRSTTRACSTTSMPGSSTHPVQRGDQRAGDLGAGGVAAGVRDAVAVVAALAGQLDLAPGVAVELRPERDELAHPVGALGHQDAHRLRVAQPDPGHEGVVEVLLRGVLRVERRGDAALRPLRSSPPTARSWSRAAPGRPARAAAARRSARRCPTRPRRRRRSSSSPGAGALRRRGSVTGVAGIRCLRPRPGRATRRRTRRGPHRRGRRARASCR